MNPSIPIYEKWALRYLAAPFVKAMPLSGAQKLFMEEGRGILSMCDSLSESALSRRANIPRLFAIEAVSMDWSIDMTLEHLLIVGKGGAKIIDDLKRGVVPDIQVSPANVKPQGKVKGREAAEKFREMVEGWPQRFDFSELDAAPPVTLYHPWFGHLTAGGWYKFLATHQQVHRKQIEKLAALHAKA